MQEKQNHATDTVNEQVEIIENESEQAVESTPEQQLVALETEVAELKDALLRARADLENQRRRSQEDVTAAHKYAIAKFAGELVAVKDYLEMALLDQSGQIETLKMGVDLTLKQLVSAFDKAQIKDIAPAAGDKLDPHQHQAMSAEDAEGEANTILRVMQKGYVLVDRVLRPAMVVVVKPKA
ncbi:nucleotide exchange factor GrpE [Neisseriaceae bacterium TC5R-5]|nr:nucleotide exchange factor GrpE [Neisseriaceae bacterium TC5R-5]